MQTVIKSLKLYFQQPVCEIGCDDFGYPMQRWGYRNYSVTVKTGFGIEWLYKEAMREYHNRYGNLVRVETIFDYHVANTGKHEPHIQWVTEYDEAGNEIIVL